MYEFLVGFAEMARGDAVGYRGSHVAVGVSVHATHSFHRALHLDWNEYRTGFATDGSGKESRDRGAASRQFVRLELDRLLHQVVLGGFLLFSSTATTFLVNVAFKWKLGFFVPIALLWHIFVQWKAREWGTTKDTPAIAKFSGLAEILLWVCVITAAVEIPNH